jgi:glycine betaine catabolism A
LAEVLREFPFAELPVCYSYKADLKCNWRAARDSQLEGYHAKSLHALSVPDFFANKENPSLHILDIKLYQRHSMLSGYGNQDHQATPVEALAAQFGAMLSSEAKGSFIDRLPPSVLNPTRSSNWSFDLYYIFPNFHFLLFGGFCLTHHMWPITVDRSVWEARLYLPQAENAAQWFSREYARCVTRDVWLEDGSTLENVQMGLLSGAITHTPLQDQELLIRHANKVVEDLIGNSGK